MRECQDWRREANYQGGRKGHNWLESAITGGFVTDVMFSDG